MTQKLVAKSRLLGRYVLPSTSKCGAGGAKAMNPIFELSLALYGYNFTLENRDHTIIKGTISFTGNIYQKTIEQINCAIL